jgi:hypothetical protein
MRPRVWVPGVAWLSHECELSVGKAVGFNGRGKAFARSKCGHFGSVVDWRHRVWLVERSALDDDIVDEHAILLAEQLLDPDTQTHARRWLSSQSLVCVSGSKLRRLTDAGLRVYTVEHGAETDDEFAIRADGGKRASWELRGMLRDMLPPDLRPEGDDALARGEKREVRTFVDRLLSHTSGGVLSETAVNNAMAARTLIEPGYGYRGETDGVAATVERVQRNLRALDALFEQVYERAEAMRDDAREIQLAIDGAPDAVEEVRLPIYDNARRENVAEIEVRLSDDGASYTVGGERRRELVLPMHPRWIVTRVQRWSPKLPAMLEAELEREERVGGANPIVAVVLVALLALIILLGLTLDTGP